MIRVDIEQGSEAWFKEKAGIPSASKFKTIITTKGAASTGKTKETLAYKYAGEIISGKAEDTFTSFAMQQGIEKEPEARELYEFLTGNEVEQVGLVYSDDKKLWLCSPDGLVNGGGLEIKCPLLSTHLKYHYDGKLPTDYFQQVQGSLFVTGLPWWDFMSYHPDFKPFTIRVFPDKEFHTKLETELLKLNAKIMAIVEKISG